MRLVRRSWSIKVRLAALLTALFIILGGALLAVSYALVRSNLSHDKLQAQTGSDVGLHEAVPPEERPLVLERVRGAQAELIDDTLRELTLQYLAIMAGMVVLSAALGWYVSGRVLRPMSEITETARRVSQESLHQRIALEGPDDELKHLADTFDSMLGRLEAGFERQAAFVRNASHELRTPLSVIRTEADVTLADEPRDPEALRRSLVAVREAGRRSERLIDALLTLAQADRADRPRTEVDLGKLARRLAEGADVNELSVELDLQEARVRGDPELLRTMTATLFDNAVRHNTPDGWIRIQTESGSEHALLEIANSGAVIAPDQVGSLAEPFRRLGAARTGDGFGLGLSIAASVARAHGGTLTIDPLDGGGLRVKIRLPAASQREARSATGGPGRD